MKPVRKLMVMLFDDHRKMNESDEDGPCVGTGKPTLDDVKQYLAEHGLETVSDLRGKLERAHMAGQSDAGVDPGYSNARVWFESQEQS